ncbi:MAG: hypothetical protein ACE5LH_05940 [Fidelibacterota bacterium]
MRAYLSGAIEHAPDGGTEWRREMTAWLKDHLGHDVFNPVEEQKKTLVPDEAENFRRWKSTDYGRFKKAVRKLIDADLHSIIHDVDYVICYWDEGVVRGGGTHGEVTLAYHAGKPVYTVLGVPREMISSWILGCSTREFDTFGDLQRFLEREYGE